MRNLHLRQIIERRYPPGVPRSLANWARRMSHKGDLRDVIAESAIEFGKPPYWLIRVRAKGMKQTAVFPVYELDENGIPDPLTVTKILVLK